MCWKVGSRATAFDYFDRGRPDFSRIDHLLYIGGHVPQFMEKYGYTRAKELEVIRLPGPGRSRTRSAQLIER